MNTNSKKAINHVKPILTMQERANFISLAKGLLSLPTLYGKFNMNYYHISKGTYWNEDYDPSESNNICGTSACALGHAPSFNIGNFALQNNWLDYFKDNFCSSLDIRSDEVYSWCFCSYWSLEDNTPKGAALRILYMLKYGIPLDEFNFVREPSIYLSKTVEDYKELLA